MQQASASLRSEAASLESAARPLPGCWLCPGVTSGGWAPRIATASTTPSSIREIELRLTALPEVVDTVNDACGGARSP